jgi:hypothetical protein
MSYIGKIPTVGDFKVCDAISVVNNQAAYTMQVGGVNVSPESANHMLVSLNGILQAPTSSFTVSGSTITFASNLVTGDVIDFIQILGNVLDLGVPSDNTVSLAKLTATGTKDATTFLRGDNTFNAPPLGGITEADAWYLDTTYTGDADITANLARVTDGGFAKLGIGMTESSGIFTFPSTGIWRIEFIAQFQDSDHNSRSIWGRIVTTVDNSTYVTASSHGTNLYRHTSGAHYTSVTTSFIFDVTNTSTHKVKFNAGATDISVRGSDSDAATQMQFIRLGDT